MSTATVTKAVRRTNDSERPRLPETLRTLQFLRTAKGKSDTQIHSMLNGALKEVGANKVQYVLERLMLHIGDISRKHNILKELGINSDKGGAQEREVFRSILRWWESNLPESFEKNIPVFAEYSVLENLMFYQLTTDRKTGRLLNKEILFPMPEKVYAYLANEIRQNRNVPLIARHLPAYNTGTTRTARKIAKCKEGKTSYEWKVPTNSAWCKVNGLLVDTEKVTLKDGDVVTWQRKKSMEVIEKQNFINDWIAGFNKVMGWTVDQYKAFRSKQNTPEQKFSSGTITDMPKSDFMKFLDGLTSGQRYRVSRMLKNEVKWATLSEWQKEWETAQEKVADKLREAAEAGDTKATEKLMKEYKVKATGKNTIDLLKDMFNGKFTETEVNNTYQAMIEKMDLVASVFPVIDGSSSMDRTAGDHSWGRARKGDISNRDVAYAMAIAFSTRNPNPEFRNSFGWFSRDFKICGTSKFRDTRPNRFVMGNEFNENTSAYEIISAKNTFTKNFTNLRQNDPGEVTSTNMSSVIDYFIKLVKDGKFTAEQLPQALLFLTDNENNTGGPVSDAMARANAIGWNPLMIFWGIVEVPSHMLSDMKNIPNCLLVGGFNESVLSQVLRGIETGSIDPEDELWAIVNDKRYVVIPEA